MSSKALSLALLSTLFVFACSSGEDEKGKEPSAQERVPLVTDIAPKALGSAESAVSEHSQNILRSEQEACGEMTPNAKQDVVGQGNEPNCVASLQEMVPQRYLLFEERTVELAQSGIDISFLTIQCFFDQREKQYLVRGPLLSTLLPFEDGWRFEDSLLPLEALQENLTEPEKELIKITWESFSENCRKGTKQDMSFNYKDNDPFWG